MFRLTESSALSGVVWRRTWLFRIGHTKALLNYTKLVYNMGMQVVIGDVLVNYQERGKSRKGTIVILHGWGRSSRDWERTADSLASRYRVILVDLPGFGLTIFPPGAVFSIHDYVEFVVQFLKKLKISHPIIIGHSLGGRIGIILGTRKILKKLILVDSAGIEERTLGIKLKILVYKTVRFFLPHDLVLKLQGMVGSTDYRDAGPMRKTFIKIVNERLNKYLNKVRVPTLLIWGDKDDVIEIKYGKVMKEAIQNSHLRIVWGTGHHPHLEKPREFEVILNEYL